ncbi:Mal13p [Saccharomyces cerevisiae x Saccharomyces kudriavzevii VIN7]|uniref:Mal13p n=1 Tax=Saccharomyces cerevisiae x Saccharomyces kudriavzevii (strain VIN7) TaxID=1095631 RepID=H0GVH4_SACCK|nr:Mal13p [Saccharomyces cerevisiae x Saccharomyces kudriavzevii VIN7]
MNLNKQTCAKQACDCCRVRRVKCDGKGPCSSCLQHNLDCTYLQPFRKRGPKSIRSRSLRRIAEVQMTCKNKSVMAGPVTSKKVPKKLIDQCLRLYHDNLYVIWPLLSYDDLHKLLEEEYDDCYVYWFLVALSAATLSDLQTEIESEERITFTGKQLSSICISSCQQFDDLEGSNVFNIMTYYCLHRSFAQASNTKTSYRLCCEATGLVTMAGLHREETYEPLSFCEQQLRRKLYYLILMTERYYAVYLHCATSLDATISPPQPEFVTDPRLSLDSFLEMIRVFTVPGKCFFDALASDSTSVFCTEDSLKKIWTELHKASLNIEPWSYGYVDISFSRHWIRILAWKLVYQMKGTKFSSNVNNGLIPVEIARDMLEDAFLTPENLYDVHGPGIPMKTLEIATALVDIVGQYDRNMKFEAWNIMHDVSKFVFSLKHYDNGMIQRFSTKCQRALITLPISRTLQVNENSKNDEADIIS